jgi:uncharacterized protein YdgA (DUF945 family)
MKKIVVALVLALAAGAGVPYLFGGRAEASYRALIARLNEEAADLRLVPESYDRGWFSSTAQTRIEVPRGHAVLWLQHRIAHGPFPWDRLRDLHFRPVQAVIETAARAAESGSAAARLSARTVLALDGAALTEIRAPADRGGSAHPGGGESLQWQGLGGELRLPPNLTRVDGSLQSAGVQWRGAAGHWTAEDLQWRLDMRRGVEGLTLGRMTLGVARLAYRPTGEAGVPVSAFGSRLSTDSTAEGGQVAVALDLGVDGVELPNRRYGPATVRLTLSRLDAPTLGRLRRGLRDLEREGVTGEEARAGAMLRVLELLPGLLAAGPRLELNLAATGPSGTFRGIGSAWLVPGPGALPVFSAEWIERLRAEAELRLPGAVVDELLATSPSDADTGASGAAAGFGQRLRSWIDGGYLVPEGSDYVLRARVEGRVLTVNGKPVELPALAGSG